MGVSSGKIPRAKISLFSDVRMGLTLDERHKARIERMMMEEEEEVKGLEVNMMMTVTVMVVIFLVRGRM